MNLYDNKTYLESLKRIAINRNIDLNQLNNKKILVTGSTGLICSYLIDVLIYANMYLNKKIHIYALGRNLEKIKSRFNYVEQQYFTPIIQDVCETIDLPEVDYIIHGASNATPKLYVEDPIGTMNSNYLGTLNLLELARKCNAKLLYISSSDIYGTSEKEILCENDYGYVDILNVRSSYASSKRASETLCISYKNQYNVDTNIVRPAHIYGPTFTQSDSRAVSDFIRNVVENHNIVMKSDGSSVRSYCYVVDAVAAILIVLLKGESGEAYNISNINNFISIKELANKICKIANKELIIDLPKDYVSSKIDENVKVIKMSSEKLEQLGWKAKYSIDDGLNEIFNILL